MKLLTPPSGSGCDAAVRQQSLSGTPKGLKPYRGGVCRKEKCAFPIPSMYGYIYLVLVDFHGKCREIYHTWMLCVWNDMLRNQKFYIGCKGDDSLTTVVIFMN